jgi:hypothetical protein
MWIKCTAIFDGAGPSEKVVQISTVDGLEEVIVYSGLVREKKLEVGPVLQKKDNNALVELPRESASGRWRLWVPETELAPT